MAVESPAWANQAKSYTAEQTRRAIFSSLARTGAGNPGIIAGGLIGATDMQISAPVSGMSVNVSTGECIIPGNEGGAQGGYYARVTSQTNLSIATSNPSNPRIDTVCATVSDSGYTEPSGGSGDQWALQVVTGTATAGATLSNLSGVAALPGSSLLLGYVLVPASATNIVSADISNRASQVSSILAQWGHISAASGTVNLASRQILRCTGSLTANLPSHSAGQQVAIIYQGASGAATISGTNINGPGLNGATSFQIGSYGAFAVLEDNGTDWSFIAGQQDTGWVALASLYASPWADEGGAYQVGQYRLSGERVTLRGRATAGNTITLPSTLTTLPSGFRPAAQETFALAGTGITDGYAYQADVSSAGVITISHPAGTWSPGGGLVQVSLSGISFATS